MTKPLSPAAIAVWEAFNQDETGVFVDYGDCLAAAIRSLADQFFSDWDGMCCAEHLRAIAAELEA